MPPAKLVPNDDDKARLSLSCSRQQKEILVDAARRSGCNLNTLIMTFALAGVERSGGAGAEPAVIINGRVGAALCARAQAQGVTPERVLEMLLLAGGT